MIPIKQFLNKIKYSNKFNQKDIKVYYYDRILKKLISIDYEDIKPEDDFIILNDSEIPLHRIYEIRNKGIIIWKRELKSEKKKTGSRYSLPLIIDINFPYKELVLMLV